MTKHSLSLFACLLLVSSCSGHSSNGPDEAHPEDVTSLEDAVTDPAAATTDNAPVTPPSNESNSIAPEAMAAQTQVAQTEEPALTPVAESAEPAVEEPTPAHTHAKAHKKNKAKLTHKKPRQKKSEPETAAVVANVAPEEVVAPQPDLTPAQQAQMAAEAAGSPAATAPQSADLAIAPTVAPTVQPVVAQASPAESTEPKSNNYLTYAGVAAVVLLGGYFFYRRRKS